MSSSILTGIRVLDLTRLAPGPYGTMLLADMGADVIVVGGGRSGLPIDAYRRGKRFINLDLKSDAGLSAFFRLVDSADVLVEGFRPAVCDKLGIGYAAIHKANPRLIYCSLTGYGQTGPWSQEAGHDINYVGLSGALGAMGSPDRVPPVPLNLIADFAGGGLFAALGIVSALLNRDREGVGQHIDVSMVDGCISLMGMHYPDWGKPVLPSRGRGLLTGEAPFYRCYECADGLFVSVGALERAFFINLWDALGLSGEPPDHMDRNGWSELTELFTQVFAGRNRDDWVNQLLGKNTCVAPVLAPDEVFSHPQTANRHREASGDHLPVSPRFSHTPAAAGAQDSRDQTREILRALNLNNTEIDAAVPQQSENAIGGLVWPPVHE